MFIVQSAMSVEDGNACSDVEGHTFPVYSMKKGWAGEELEMEHQREQLQRTPGQDKRFAAVDITEFQNFEVGSGYQARHVIRQKKSLSESIEVKDMSQAQRNKSKTLNSGEAEMRADLPVMHTTTNNDVIDSGQSLNKYLQCPGVREFRRELEQLIASDKGDTGDPEFETANTAN